MTVSAARGGFFDKAAVGKELDRATKSVFSKFGAFVRRRAQTSIRKRKDVSSPFGPPHGHVGHLRRLIFFAYDGKAKSVVIGPALLRSGSKAAGLLEFGGQRPVVGEAAQRYRPRPFMGPAFVKERESLPKLWKDALKGSGKK